MLLGSCHCYCRFGRYPNLPQFDSLEESSRCWNSRIHAHSSGFFSERLFVRNQSSDVCFPMELSFCRRRNCLRSLRLAVGLPQVTNNTISSRIDYILNLYQLFRSYVSLFQNFQFLGKKLSTFWF